MPAGGMLISAGFRRPAGREQLGVGRAVLCSDEATERHEWRTAKSLDACGVASQAMRINPLSTCRGPGAE